MEFSILIGIIIGLGIVCATILSIAEKYFEYKENTVKEDKENNNGN